MSYLEGLLSRIPGLQELTQASGWEAEEKLLLAACFPLR